MKTLITKDGRTQRSTTSNGNIDFEVKGSPFQTVRAGDDVILTCQVKSLGNYKACLRDPCRMDNDQNKQLHLFYSPQVAWVRIDTQTILTIHHNIITRNQRVSLSHHDREIWRLHLERVQESDRGWYMCQVNTDPMRSQRGFLEVVGKGEVSERRWLRVH